MYIIGTDEAGYGPNLGPLVISASVWETETEDFSVLNSELNSKGIIISDSKKLYHGGNSLRVLETSVLSILQSLAPLPQNLSELQCTVAGTDFSDVPERIYVPIPHSVSRETIRQSSEIFTKILDKYSIKLLALRSTVLTAAAFNKKLDQYDSVGAKASLLSDTTVQLIKHLIEKHFLTFSPPPRFIVLCDKHGGRNRYLDILIRFFPDEFFQTLCEGRERSVYRTKNIEFRFIAKGESQLPVALSSMLSKYIRELAMLEFNGYWQKLIPGLKPTAGYPEDAKRFIKEVAERIGISLDIKPFWRKR